MNVNAATGLVHELKHLSEISNLNILAVFIEAANWSAAQSLSFSYAGRHSVNPSALSGSISAHLSPSLFSLSLSVLFHCRTNSGLVPMEWKASPQQPSLPKLLSCFQSPFILKWKLFKTKSCSSEWETVKCLVDNSLSPVRCFPPTNKCANSPC